MFEPIKAINYGYVIGSNLYRKIIATAWTTDVAPCRLPFHKDCPGHPGTNEKWVFLSCGHVTIRRFDTLAPSLSRRKYTSWQQTCACFICSGEACHKFNIDCKLPHGLSVTAKEHPGWLSKKQHRQMSQIRSRLPKPWKFPPVKFYPSQPKVTNVTVNNY